MDQGWWQDGDIVYLTVLPNNPVEIKTNEKVVDFDIIEISENFNNHSFAVTIAGHATEDLFKWSKRFDRYFNAADDIFNFTLFLRGQAAPGPTQALYRGPVPSKIW